jgi:Flp pilus assembly protein TadD
MSVINTMLRQLDARRAGAPGVAGVQATAVPATSRRRLGAIVLAGAAAIGLAAFGDASLLGGKPAQLPRPMALADAAAAVPIAAPPVAALPPVAAASAAAPAERPVAEAALSPPAPPPPLRVAALTRRPQPVRPAPVEAPAEAAVDSPAVIDKQLRTMSPAQRAALAYRQARELSAEGRDGSALERALEAVKLDADLSGARQLAAVLLAGRNRPDEATALLRDGLQRQPQQPQLAYLLARLLTQSGDLQAALSQLQPADGLSAAGHSLRAGLLARLGRYGEAVPAYQAALRGEPDNAANWLGLGVALDAQGQRVLARQAFSRARDIGQLSGDVLTYIEQKLASLP